MPIRKSFLHAFFIFTFLFSWPFDCPAPNPLEGDEAQKVYKYLSRKWVPVAYKKPLGFETIFNELDPSLWPVLPPSYEWRVEDNQVSLFKHKFAPEHKFDFVTYATDDLSRFNFLSRWDGVTHHSYAYARHNSPLSSYDDARGVFPISEYTYKKSKYMRGHCIDFLDTYGLSEISKVKSGTMIETISTLDPRNYIPEPRDPTPHWGEVERKNLVREIQESQGCYAQYIYYGLNYELTDDETRTAIPKGIYFLSLDSKRTPQNSYHIPWDHPIHNKKASLNDTLVKDKFVLSPFVHKCAENADELPSEELPLKYTLPARGLSSPQEYLSPQDYHKIVQAADHETRNVMGKLALTIYLIDQEYDPRQIQIWLKRLIKHGIKIHEQGAYGFMDTPLVDNLRHRLKKSKEIDPHGNYYEWLIQLINNDKDEVKERGRETYPESSLVIKDAPLKVAIKEIDVERYDANGATKVVLRQLQGDSKSPIRLLNMSTGRANRIADSLKSEFSTPADRKSLIIEYTLKPKSQTKGVAQAFSKVGITPKKYEKPPPMDGTTNNSVHSDSHSDTSVVLSPNSSLYQSSPRELDLERTEDDDYEICLALMRKLSANKQDQIMKQLQKERLGSPNISPILRKSGKKKLSSGDVPFQWEFESETGDTQEDSQEYTDESN